MSAAYDLFAEILADGGHGSIEALYAGPTEVLAQARPVDRRDDRALSRERDADPAGRPPVGQLRRGLLLLDAPHPQHLGQ